MEINNCTFELLEYLNVNNGKNEFIELPKTLTENIEPYIESSISSGLIIKRFIQKTEPLTEKIQACDFDIKTESCPIYMITSKGLMLLESYKEQKAVSASNMQLNSRQTIATEQSACEAKSANKIAKRANLISIISSFLSIAIATVALILSIVL